MGVEILAKGPKKGYDSDVALGPFHPVHSPPFGAVEKATLAARFEPQGNGDPGVPPGAGKRSNSR